MTLDPHLSLIHQDPYETVLFLTGARKRHLNTLLKQSGSQIIKFINAYALFNPFMTASLIQYKWEKSQIRMGIVI